MRLQRLLCSRRWRIVCKKLRRRKLAAYAFGTLCLLVIYWLLHQQQTAFTNPLACAAIDVVYTWVNGSDTDFIAELRKYDANYDPARYDDKNELRYSLRSLEKYAPWIRHVYIVTNGQIPHWLDLSYEKVSIVPHALLTPEPSLLPTFSSAAIETFLHRIPKLSERFLYLNDDIFLNAPLYADDLYTEADGVRIYQAWLVPDCAEDCPWTYIGDGACDQHCNIAPCQYDGADCANASAVDKMLEYEVQQQRRRRRASKRMRNQTYAQHKNNTISAMYSFKQLMRHKNLSSNAAVQRLVQNYNRHKQLKPLMMPTLPVEAAAATTTTKHSNYKSSKDIYSQSLIHSNMLLNEHYGFKARNVLAHVGFLLERQIVASMSKRFAKHMLQTLSHRFRAVDDLQFAFMYFSFLMSETKELTVEQIFDEFDTDNSQTWSDREVRTFLARVYPLPLDWSAVRFFEEVIHNCSRNSGLNGQQLNKPHFTTLVYERYEDSDVPTITRELVAKCSELALALVSNFAKRPKYKFIVHAKREQHSNFMMLTSNVSEVVQSLDRFRRKPKKFNCINDNLEPQFAEDNELIRHLLEDFYLSFFPRRSKFELEPQYRNRFANWWDYQRWRRRKRAALYIGYCASLVLIAFLLRYLCLHRTKLVRRYVQCL